MITDPENPNEQPYEFDEPIIAVSEAEAERICRQKAQQQGIKFKRLQLPGRVRPGQNQRYLCIFEVNPIED
jgi:hypothetical protein